MRNPFARVLSGYLDKIENGDPAAYPELKRLRRASFESFLQALADHDPHHIDDHFRPQHINLNYPKVAYDAVFFLENPEAIARFLEQISPGFTLERFSPHARSAAEKLASHYSPAALALVRDIYAKDFELFGYSADLDEALNAPGAMITADGLLPLGRPFPSLPDPKCNPRDTTILENTLRVRWLVERRLI